MKPQEKVGPNFDECAGQIHNFKSVFTTTHGDHIPLSLVMKELVESRNPHTTLKKR